MTTVEGVRSQPPVLGALAFLVMNLAVGIGAFVVLTVLFAVGFGTAVVWAGLPLLGLAVLLCRGGGQVERARVYAMLDTYIDSPLKELPEKKRWQARVRDGATWRGLAYFLLLLPIGVAEFGIMVATWSASLGLVALPVYFRFLPDERWGLWDSDRPWLVVDSTFEALPFSALGVLLLAATVVLTRAMGAAHARFARMMLGPTGGVV